METRWIIFLVLSAAGIASFFPLTKILVGVDPLLVGFLRCGIASVALLPIMWYRHSLALPPRSEWPLFILLGLGTFIPTSLLFAGISRTNSVLGAILMNTQPLLIALFSPYLIAEHRASKKFFAIMVGFVGVAIVVSNGRGFEFLFQSEYLLGVILMMSAAIVAGLNKMYSKSPVRRFDGLYVTFFTITIGSTILGLGLAASGKLIALSELRAEQWLAGILIGVVSSAIPWTVWSSSLKHLDVHVAASFNLLIPVFAALYSFIFLTEEFTLWMMLGMALTSVGIYMVQREEGRPII